MLFVTFPDSTSIKLLDVAVDSKVSFDYHNKPRQGVVRKMSKAVVDSRSKPYLQLELEDGSFRSFNLAGISNMKRIEA